MIAPIDIPHFVLSDSVSGTGSPILLGRQKSGKAGGTVTKKRYGSDFYKRIGKIGGSRKKSSRKAS